MENIGRLSKSNRKGEYYLTDMIPLAAGMGERIIGVEVSNPDEVIGVNTIEELKMVEGILLDRG